MGLAPESRPFLLGAALLVAPAWWLGGPLAAGAPLLAAAFIAFFFRDPARPVPAGEGLVLAPADGRVVADSAVSDPLFPGGVARRLSIFLSIFNVHVNRAPVSGEVQRVLYTRGRFRAAFHGKASEENERNRVEIATATGPVVVTQIAGAIARRIVCDVRAGDRVIAGRRFGLIRFGSRVDLTLPSGTEVGVVVGQRVRATSTVIGRLPAAAGVAREEVRAASR